MARGGDAVPARTVAQELTGLAAVLRSENVRRLLVAGDLFEDGRVERDDLVAEFLAWLEGEGIELAGVVPGNHDRGLGNDERLRISKDGAHPAGIGSRRLVPAGPWSRWRALLKPP